MTKSNALMVDEDLAEDRLCRSINLVDNRPTLDTLEALLGPGNFKPISRLTSLSPSHISRILRGKIGTTLSTASRIAGAVGITVDDLHRYIEATKENS